MAENEFSYRPILEKLTDVVNERGLDPYEAYRWLYEAQEANGLRADTYCSTSITSGGHARDESLQMRQVIDRNTNSAKLLAEQLAIDGELKPEASIEPVFVGKTKWNQAEYMEFWLSVIGGYKFTPGFVARDVDALRRTAERSFDETGLNKELMVSKASAEVRAAEYFRMSSVFAEMIKNGIAAEPISQVIRMIDTELSLGAQTERAFARQIGAKVMNICVVKPATLEDLDRVNHILAVDAARLISFGATVFDTNNNQVHLSLVEDAA